MSDNNELLNGIPSPKSPAPPSTDTGSVNKVQPEEDDTRTRKTVKLSAAGMMPSMGGAAKVRPEDLAVAKPAAPSVPPPVAPAVKPPVPPPVPGAAKPAAPSTDTGNIPKQATEDTRTRKTVRINAATVEDTVKLQRAAAAPPPPAAAATPAPAPEPAKIKLSMPSPAKPAAPRPAAPAEKPAAPAEKPATGGIRPPKEKANLSLKKDESAPSAPSSVEKGLNELAGKSRAANAPSALYTVIGVITVLALAATVVFASQYLNIWSPEWANGFTLLK